MGHYKIGYIYNIYGVNFLLIKFSQCSGCSFFAIGNGETQCPGQLSFVRLDNMRDIQNCCGYSGTKAKHAEIGSGDKDSLYKYTNALEAFPMEEAKP